MEIEYDIFRWTGEEKMNGWSEKNTKRTNTTKRITTSLNFNIFCNLFWPR